MDIDWVVPAAPLNVRVPPESDIEPSWVKAPLMVDVPPLTLKFDPAAPAKTEGFARQRAKPSVFEENEYSCKYRSDADCPIARSPFPGGTSKNRICFCGGGEGRTINMPPHVVVNGQGQWANRIVVKRPDGTRVEATVGAVDQAYDLARLDSRGPFVSPVFRGDLPEIGENVVFAGLPQGLQRASAFPGMVSNTGLRLLARPQCNLIQLAGMINNGNSGGPVIDVQRNAVIGLITAKYVPLLQEIDRLTAELEAIPQFPRNVGIGEIDFSAFVNLTVQSMWQTAAVLRLVQVGTGWAIPTQYFQRVGVNDVRNV